VQRFSEDEYIAHLFGIATGWLGWPPSEAWSATVPEIDAALEQRIKWLKMTTPGASEEKPKPKATPFSVALEKIKALPGTKVYGE